MAGQVRKDEMLAEVVFIRAGKWNRTRKDEEYV